MFHIQARVDFQEFESLEPLACAVDDDADELNDDTFGADTGQ